MYFIQQELRKLIKHYHTKDPFELCSFKNIKCINVPLDKSMNGFALYYERNWLVFINKDLSKVDKEFTCAHELGHILLHKKLNNIYMCTSSNISRSAKDKEADIFSALLLIPNITSNMLNNRSIDELSQLLDYPVHYLKLRAKYDVII